MAFHKYAHGFQIDNLFDITDIELLEYNLPVTSYSYQEGNCVWVKRPAIRSRSECDVFLQTGLKSLDDWGSIN